MLESLSCSFTLVELLLFAEPLPPVVVILLIERGERPA